LTLNAWITGNLLVNGTIVTDKLKVGSVSQVVSAVTDSATLYNGGGIHSLSGFYDDAIITTTGGNVLISTGAYSSIGVSTASPVGFYHKHGMWLMDTTSGTMYGSSGYDTVGSTPGATTTAFGSSPNSMNLSTTRLITGVPAGTYQVRHLITIREAGHDSGLGGGLFTYVLFASRTSVMEMKV
jgi:hypothetical protein